MQAVVAAEIDEVEDAFLEAAVANAGAGFDELGAQSRIAADGAGHLLHSGACGFEEGGDVVSELMRCLPIRRDIARSHPWVAPARRVGALRMQLIDHKRS